jgi:hypothetical protein
MGLIDYKMISVKISGNIVQVDISNIRELTTYALRCYYQERFYGRTTFEIEDLKDYSVNAYVPNFVLKNIILPEGLIIGEIEGL